MEQFIETQHMCFLYVSELIDQEPVIFSRGGHPLWFSDGDLAHGESEYKILRSVVEIAGIPTEAWGAQIHLRFHPARTSTIPTYGIGFLTRELEAYDALWTSFESGERYLEVGGDGRAASKDTIMSFNFLGQIEPRMGLSLFTDGWDGPNFTSISLFVSNESEANELRTICEQMKRVGRNSYGASTIAIGTHVFAATEQQ